jgi:integrase/recombinase XerD
VRVVKQQENGIVRRVVLLDDRGDEAAPVNRFLSHLTDSDYSPNTVCAYAYDLRHLVQFCDQQGLGWNDFRPSTALEFLAYLRRVPSRRPAQRLGLTVATERGRLLSAATVQRMLAATSSFFEWAVAAEQYAVGRTRCSGASIMRWAGSLSGTGRSSARRAVSSRCAARCGCGCRCGCPGR